MEKNISLLDKFADIYCLDYIAKAVSHFVTSNYDKLECRSNIDPQGAKLENIKIEFTTNIKTYDNIIKFDVIVSTDIEVYETFRGEDESDCVSQWFRVPLLVKIEEKIIKQQVDEKNGGIEIYQNTGKNISQVSATNNLIPVIYSKNYDAEATRFLKKFCPEVLEKPMPVPLEKIAKIMGIPPINYEKHLSPDFSIYGRICFVDEDIDVFNELGVPEKVKTKRGQIFIDNDTSLLCNVGCIRNTIAHELFHWTRHRLFATIKRLLDSHDLNSIRCRVRPQGALKKINEELTDEEWIELQANSISPRIIMPKETAKPKAIEILKKYKYNSHNHDENKLRSAIFELAEFFQVSKQLATIRLSQLGIKQAQDIFNNDYDKNVNCASQIPQQDILREYKENENFRNVINTGLFRYAEGRFIINDVKYLNKVDGGIYLLTDYAREYLDECALKFETIETSESGYRGDGLYRRNKNGFALAKKYIHEATKLETAETKAKASEAFKNYTNEKREYIKAIGSGTCFSESFNALMKAYFEPLGIKEHKYGAEIFDRTGISDKLYRDMRNGNQNYCPSHRTIVALCAGLDFDLEIAEALLQKGGKIFSDSNEHFAFKSILTAFIGCDFNERNSALINMGFGSLIDD